MRIPKQSPEISDRIVDFDGATLERRPVMKSEVLREFQALNNRFAVRVVEKLPVDRDGVLDPQAMDRLLVTVHCEMQRMSEEFQHGQRMAELLNPLLNAIRDSSSPRRLNSAQEAAMNSIESGGVTAAIGCPTSDSLVQPNSRSVGPNTAT